MKNTGQLNDGSNIPPPIGAAPDGQDFVHPNIISAIVSVISFAIGFAGLYFSGAWTEFREWADAPFLIYLAILLPVIIGFSIYGVLLFFVRVFGSRKNKSRWF